MPGFASLYFVDFSSMTFCKSPLRAFPAFGTSSTLAFHARVAESKSAVSFFFSARDAARWFCQLGGRRLGSAAAVAPRQRL